MAAYESGVSFERLKAIADAGATDRLSAGVVRPNKGKWQGVISYSVTDPITGKGKLRQITKTFTDTTTTGRGATSKPKAEKMLAAWRAQVIKDAKRAAGIAADPTSTVRACVESFIDGKEKRGEIRGSTATNYRNAAKRIFKHSLAAAPLQELTTPTVQSWVDELATKLAGKTVRISFNLLDAVCRKILGADHNPCAGVSLPNVSHNARAASSRPNALTVASVARLNKLLDELDTEAAKNDETHIMALAARMALHTGMRAEEVCGLRWRDVDQSHRVVAITQVIQRAEVPKVDEQGEQIRDKRGNVAAAYDEYAAEPKTEKSSRYIPLTDELASALALHKKRVAAFVEAMEPHPKKRPDIESLYVLGDVDGSFMSPRRLGQRWRKFATKNELLGTNGTVATFHDLRHTAATRMISAGIDVATVSHILGHAENSVTLNKYVTSDEESKRMAIDRMNSIFSARNSGNVVLFDPERTGTNG